MAKIPIPTELLDTDSLIPALAAPDHMAVLMLSEHLFTLLGTLWHDHLPVKNFLQLDKNGKGKKADASELLEGYGPLSTPSSRIRVCYLSQLICKPLYEGMEAVRSIRNSFAHSRIPLNLENPGFDSRLERLATTWAPKIDRKKAPFSVVENGPDNKKLSEQTMTFGRAVFFVSIGSMVGHLRKKHFGGRGSHETVED